MNSIISVERKNCTGCGSCSNICPNSAIEMKSTFEGFSYPYADLDKCVMCGKCSEICPVINETADIQPKWYMFLSDDFTSWNSVGGGAMTCAIQYAASEGMKIYAPVFDYDYSDVHHKLLDLPDDLSLLCQVSYVESKAWLCYPEIQKLLDENEKVLFFGTPCQTDGLRRFVGETKNLLTVSFICEGVSSGFAWSDYIQSRNENSRINDLKLSHKELGLSESIRIRFEDDSIYEELEKGDWITRYHQGVILRQSCCDCKYDVNKYNSDISVGNYSSVNKGGGKGTSLLGVNSESGKEFIEKMTSGKNYICKEISKTDADKFLLSIKRDRVAPDERKRFFEMCYTHGFKHITDGISEKEHDGARKFAIDYHMGDGASWIILNTDVWSKRNICGEQYLLSNGTAWQRIFLPLDHTLKIGARYSYSIKLKMKTTCPKVRIMLSDKAAQDSACPTLQNLNEYGNDAWAIVTGTYAATRDTLKYVMLSSTDFTGNDPYICFDWIRIWEE